MTQPIRTFCLGLNRTGTGTLRAAFADLGYRVSRHSPADIRAYRDGDTAALLARAGEYDFLSDLPWPLIWRDLHAHFGDGARYILTTRRSAEAWVESQKRHTEAIHPGTISTRVAYGYKYPHGVEAHFAEFYERHNAEVRAHFAGRSDIFAEYCVDAAPGWGPICALLGREAPDAPIPHRNASSNRPGSAEDRATNQAQIEAQLARLEKRRRRSA